MKTNRLKFYFLNTLLTIALCSAYGYFNGILSVVLSVLIAALLGVVLHREHIALGVTNASLVLVILSVFLGPVNGLISGVPMVLLAISLALGTRFKMNFYHLLLLCSVLYLADILVSFEIAGHLSGGEISFSSMMLETGDGMREMMKAYYSDPAYQAMIDEAVSMTVDTSIMLAPSFFTVFCVVLAYVLLWVYKKIQIAQNTDMSSMINFNMMQADKMFAIFYLVLFVLLTASKKGIFFDALCNVVVILTFLFFALGLSVFNFKLKQKGAGDKIRKLLTAALICFSTMFFMLPLIALVICGLTDAFFDYRKLRPKETEEQ